MKVFLSIICLLVMVQGLHASDNTLLKYVNQYRQANGKASLKESSDLQSLAQKQTETQTMFDSAFHSKINTYECISRGYNLVPTKDDKERFIMFLKTYYNIEYKEPKNNSEVINYLYYYIVYSWDKSPEHKKIILRDDVSAGATYTFTGDIQYEKNDIIVNGVSYSFNNIISHYNIKFYSTINLN